MFSMKMAHRLPLNGFLFMPKKSPEFKFLASTDRIYGGAQELPAHRQSNCTTGVPKR